MTNHFLGFCLTVVAGLATVLGAAFIPLLKYGTGQTVTTGALGFAAGVMLYVSFVDVLGGEAKEFFGKHLEERGETNGMPPGEHIMVRVYVALFFFIGLGVAMCLDKIMEALQGTGAMDHRVDPQSSRDVELTSGASSRPLGVASQTTGHDPATAPTVSTKQDSSSLERVSLVAFVALTLHNFPEGLATFFGGGTGSFTVPFAIAMHNIPEGAAIAIPIYQSSGDAMRALRTTCIAGMAQPAGALMGWALIVGLKIQDVSHFVYGACYACTAGIMVCVSLMELIPEALQGGSPFYVGCCIFGGFLVMEVSIILLGLAGV
jgi:ZIP family zinc transporter